MANPNTNRLGFMRLRLAHGFICHAMSVRFSAMQALCIDTRLVPATGIGLAQGRIVSISRGYPPPKKR
jgi:hypothetical protein